MALLPLLLLAVALGFGKGLTPETVTAETGRNSEPKPRRGSRDEAEEEGQSRGRRIKRGGGPHSSG